MQVRDIFLKIETITDYSPVSPDKEVSPPIVYERDCMRNVGHENGIIPPDEVNARRLTALVYREYLDPGYLVPKPDKLVVADINEPAFDQRVPGTVIYARPDDRLRIHVRNDDVAPHSFHLHGLRYGIDSDGAWPFGVENNGGGRSDGICPGQTWTYTFDVTEYMIGAWPFHDHYRNYGLSVNRGLFGGVIVLPGHECDELPKVDLPTGLVELLHCGLEPQQPAGAAPRLRKAVEIPVALAPHLALLDELVRAPGFQPLPKPPQPLHIPLFFHLMSGVDRREQSLPSLCFNGRSFVGNTPTILAEAGQRVRWYVFNLDIRGEWHNFHPHGQRWQLGQEHMDVRSLGPGESYVAETVAPPVLLLPPEIEKYQHADYRPYDAKPFQLSADFLFQCNSERDLTQGMAGLMRSTQTVWLTPQDAARIQAETGLPLDTGNNACPIVDSDHCSNVANGKWEQLPGLPQITFMHAVLLPNTTRVLFWGYGPRPDQSRIWDQATGAYTQPANQPTSISPDANIWSGAHAFLNDAAGTILVLGGYISAFLPPPPPPPPRRPVLPMTLDTEHRAFLFDPPTLTWSDAADLNIGRFYTTSISLGDGRVMSLFGQETVSGSPNTSLEVFTPGGAGSWAAPVTLPFNYFYYPWTFLLPNGDLFIAGPQKPARRFDWTVTPVADDPAKRFNQFYPFRGNLDGFNANMDGTAVLLPLRPPNYEPRVLIAGGAGVNPNTSETAEWIDLSVPTPAWQPLPNMNFPRDKVNSVLLPDGLVMIVGGVDAIGGPAEFFDPEDSAAGFKAGPPMQFVRGYHSAAILLPDGSVLVGGDPNGPNTPHERYLPPYFFKPRPNITNAPATIGYGDNFTIDTPQANSIAEVVLIRPGAVTHAFNQSQRYVGCEIVSVGGTSVQATAPPNGNVAPPGHYLLFVVNSDRVPSQGVWIKLG